MNRTPRALFFAPAFAPFQFSEALVNSKLALAFMDAGWELAVFAATAGGGATYSDQWSDPWLPLRGLRKEGASMLHQHKIGRAISLARNAVVVRHPVSGALWAEAVAQQALLLHREHPFDLMMSRSTSCYAHLPAMLLRRQVEIPWVANWNDPPGHRFPAPYHYPLPAVQGYFKDRYLRAAASSADVNSFPSQHLLGYLRSPLGLECDKKAIVIPHVGLGWRGSQGSPVHEKFRISHAGNLSRERDPSSFLRALAWLIDFHPGVSIEFEVIGHMDESFVSLVSDLGLDRAVLRTPGLPFLECLRKMEEADVLLLIEAPCREGIFFPSKLVDYCEVGRPVLAVSPPGGVVEGLINTYHFGEFAPTGDEMAIRAGLSRLLENRAGLGSARYEFSAIREYTAPKRVVDAIVASVR